MREEDSATECFSNCIAPLDEAAHVLDLALIASHVASDCVDEDRNGREALCPDQRDSVGDLRGLIQKNGAGKEVDWNAVRALSGRLPRRLATLDAPSPFGIDVDHWALPHAPSMP